LLVIIVAMLKWCYSPPTCSLRPGATDRRYHSPGYTSAQDKLHAGVGVGGGRGALFLDHPRSTMHTAHYCRRTDEIGIQRERNNVSLDTSRPCKNRHPLFSSTLLFRYYTQAASIAESVKRRSDVCYRKNTSVLTGIYSKWLTRGNTDAAGVRAGRSVAVVPRSWSWTGL